jgi:hypothetical protein
LNLVWKGQFKKDYKRAKKQGSLAIHIVPDWKNHLAAIDLACGEAIQFFLRPLFLQEVGANDDDSVAGVREPMIDRAAKAVADGQGEFVKPHADTSLLHERKQGTLKSGSTRKKVTSRKQAIGIGLSEARRADAKVPPKRSSSKRK